MKSSVYSEEKTKLLEELNQTFDRHDPLLDELDQARDIREAEIILRKSETNLRKEIKQNLALLRAVKKIARAEWRHERVKARIALENAQEKLKSIQEDRRIQNTRH